MASDETDEEDVLLLHAYVYGEVPPETEVEILPLAPPLHETFVAVKVTARTAGCVKVLALEVVHPLLSVTVTVYVPMATEETDEVDVLLLHK